MLSQCVTYVSVTVEEKGVCVYCMCVSVLRDNKGVVHTTMQGVDYRVITIEVTLYSSVVLTLRELSCLTILS